MSLLDTALGWFGFEWNASRQDGDNFRTNQVTLAEYNDRQAMGESAVMGLAATWACINLLAGTIASLPLMVYRTDASGKRTVARDHPLYYLLHDSPNYDQTALDFLEFMCGSIELHGNGYAEKRKSGSRITSLVPIRPDLMRVLRKSDGSLEYRWTANGVQSVVGQDNMLHVRGFGGGPLGGASTLSVCRSAFGAALSVEHTANAMFRNGARPSGVMTTKVQLKAEEHDRLEKRLQEKFVGAINAGRPMVLDNEMAWSQLTIDPTDAQMLESRKFSVEEICRVFGVPPHMVGHTESSTSWGTGLEQQTLGFQKFTLRRRLKRIEMAMEQQLLTPQDRAAGITIEFSLEGLLRGDTAARFNSYSTGLQNGIYTINEVRAFENMPPVVGGDVPRMQMQNVPITEAASIAAPAGEGRPA